MGLHGRARKELNPNHSENKQAHAINLKLCVSQTCPRWAVRSPSEFRHPWTVEGKSWASWGLLLHLASGGSLVCCLCFGVWGKGIVLLPSFYNQSKWTNLPWTAEDSPRRKLSQASRKQHLWPSFAGGSVAKLHLGFDLDVLSQGLVFKLLPRAFSNYCSQTRRIYQSTQLQNCLYGPVYKQLLRPEPI